MKYKELVNNKEINAYLKKGDENLGQLGFTDHSKTHCMQVAAPVLDDKLREKLDSQELFYEMAYENAAKEAGAKKAQ